MKKIIYFLLFCACVSVTITSCKDDNDVFELSAAQRLQKAQNDAVEALQTAKNGWIMQYYSDTASAGGFTMLAKFDDQMNVSIAGESVIVGTHQVETSQYEMIGDRGPVLSFATYNKLFHLFSDPQTDGLGLQGDYEFMVLKASNDEIILQGKKRNAYVKMTPLPETETWDGYLTKIDEINKAFTETSPFKWNIFIDNGSEGEDTLQVSINKYRSMKIIRSYILDETTTDQPQLIGTRDTEELSACFIVTPEGLQMYAPTVAGKDTIYKFSWDANNGKMIEANKRMEPVKMSPVKLFSISEDSWIVDTLDMPAVFATYYNATANAIKAERRAGNDFVFTLGFSYISSPLNKPVMYFTPTSGSQGLLFLEYVVTEPNSITIQMNESQYDQDGVNTFQQISELQDLLKYISNKTLLVETDNPLNPTILKFHNSFGSHKHLFSLKKYGGNQLFVLNDNL